MRTVGEILKSKRLEKGMDLDKIEEKIRVRKKFLVALEANDWESLPSLPYIKGFIRSYSLFLDLNPERTMAIFRRQFLEEEKKGLLPKGLSEPINNQRLNLTPQKAVVSLILLFLLVFFGFIFIQYRQLTSPPFLEITSPKEGEVLNNQTVKIVGKTEADATISVDGEKIAVSQTGDFSTSMTLPPGINTILLEATKKNGKKTDIVRTIKVEIF